MAHSSVALPLLGERISFAPSKGQVVRYGSVVDQNGTKASVHLDGDPFPVWIDVKRIRKVEKGKEQKMAKITVKELRKRAEKYGIPGWEEMSVADLRGAVREASATAKSKSRTKATKPKSPAKVKTKTTKAKTKSTVTKTKVAKGESNSYRPGTQRAIIAGLLLEGGTLPELRTKLQKQVKLINRDGKAFNDKEVNRCILWTGWHMVQNFGYRMEKEGRGEESRLKVIPGK